MMMHIEYSPAIFSVTKYRNACGFMNVNLDNFFPTTNKKFKIFMSAIHLSLQQEEHIQTLKAYFRNQINNCEAEIKALSKTYLDAKQLIADSKNWIETKRKPNGLRFTEAEIKQLQKDLKLALKTEKRCVREFNKNKRYIKSYQAHIKELDKWG